MRSSILAVLSAITLALTCAGGERGTVELNCFEEDARAQSVNWYWYEDTRRAGVLHPARAMTKEGSLSIPGVSGYDVNEWNSSLTLKFDRCDVTVDLQCTYLDGEDALRRYMFKVSGCIAYRTEGPPSPARNRTEHADAEEFTFRCFGDEAVRRKQDPSASWYWNLEDEAHDPAPEGVRAHGSHNNFLTLRLNSCNVTLDIQCLAHELRDYSAWTHFRLENCRQFKLGVTQESTYRVTARGQFRSPDRRLDLQCPDAYPDEMYAAEWTYGSRHDRLFYLHGQDAVPALSDYSVNVSNHNSLTVRLKTCDDDPVRFECTVVRYRFVHTLHSITVKYCKVFQSTTTKIMVDNATILDLRCGDARPEKALRVLWYREHGGGTHPVNPNGTLPGVMRHRVNIFTDELTLLFKVCDESLYLQCALVRSGVEESRHRYQVRNCTASHLGLVGRSESGAGATDTDRGNASHVHLRCPGVDDNNTIDVSWVPAGNWTLPVAVRPTNATGEIVLVFQVCDRRLGYLQCVHVRRGAGAVRHLFRLNGCNASYLGVVRDGDPPAPSGPRPSNASALTLRCLDAGFKTPPVVQWFWQRGQNTHLVRSPESLRVAIPGVTWHSLDNSTGDLTLIFHRCDLTTVFHCTVPAIGKAERFTVRNCTSAAVGQKGHTSIPASSSSERKPFWLVLLASAVFVGYPVG